MRTSTARRTTITVSLAVLLLAGCANLSGLDGTSSYGCKAPEGVKCDSVSGTYHNAIQNNLPSQRRSAPTGPADLSVAPAAAAAGRTLPATTPALLASAARTPPAGEGAAYLAAPLRAAPRVLRLWIKPWEDAERDLNGESLVYVQVDNGRWLVDHVQRQAREPYAAVRPAKLPPPATKGGAQEAGKAAAGPAPAEDGVSITQALRALQGRPAPAADR